MAPLFAICKRLVPIPQPPVGAGRIPAGGGLRAQYLEFGVPAFMAG
ncbi:MAG: hypothetical protein Q7U28_14520 [Aquabacterium sp.]|nr:hypothetical protein [Aquabacterium sp.]